MTDHQPKTRSPFFKISLQWVMILPFVVQTVGIVGLVGYLSYQSGQQAVENLANQLMGQIGDRTKQNLDHYLSAPKIVVQSNAILLAQNRLDGYKLDAMMQQFVHQMSIFSELSAIGIANENSDFLSVERPLSEGLTIRKRDVTSSDRNFYRYLSDRNGQNLILQETRNNYNPHNDPPSNPWYSAAKKHPEGIWRTGVTLSQGQNKPILYVMRFLPFYDIKGKFQGVLSAGVYLTRIGDFLRSLSISNNGQMFVMERNGFLVATSTGEVPFDSTDRKSLPQNVTTWNRRLPALQSQNPLTTATAQLLAKQSFDLTQIDQPQRLQLWVNDTQYFVEVTPLNGELNWLMVVVLPAKQFMGEIQTNLNRTLLLCGLALVVSVVSGIWTSRRIARSLRRLTKATQSFAKENFDAQFPVTHIVEVQTLTEGFEKMVLQLQASEQMRSHYQQDLERQVTEKTLALIEAQRIARVGSWEMEVSTGEITWSVELFRVFGIDSTTKTPKYPDMFDRVVPEDRDKLRAAVEQAIADGTPYSVEYGNFLADHSICYLLSHGEAVFDEQGKVIKLRGTAQDVSDRKQAEISLKKALKELNYHIENTPLATIRWDQEFRVQYWSKQAEAIFGWKMEEVLGKKMYDWQLIYEDDLEQVHQNASTLLRGKSVTSANRNYHKDGSMLYCEWHNSVLSDESGNLISVLSLVQNVTDRQQLEFALQVSENKLNDILNSATAAITRLLLKPDGNWEIDYVSNGCEIISGYTSAELTTDQSLWLNLINPEDWQPIEGQIYADIFAERSGTYTYRILHKNGTWRWISQTNHSHWDATQDVWSVTIISTDISDRKQAELALAEAKESAEAATKAKSAFLANMSHEIRTPMNGVIGMTQLLETTPLNEEQADFVKTIKDSSDALLTVINDILDFSKIESGMLEIEASAFNLEEVVISVCKLLESQAVIKKIQLQYNIDPNIPTIVIGDRTRLRQILLNLVGNAVKFTQQGQISIFVNEMPTVSTISSNKSEESDLEAYQLLFAIADTGIGIQGDRLEQLFQPFTQADVSISRKYGGTGLGLAISKRLVELMGGTIWVESCDQVGGTMPINWQPNQKSHQKSQGSTFYFAIAVSINSAIAQSPVDKEINNIPFDDTIAQKFPLRILIVEDNKVNQMVAKRLLSRLGYHVDMVNNGLEAVAAVQKQFYDLIFMDVQMPEMDGLTATKLIRKLICEKCNGSTPQVKIVAMTANALPEDHQACLDAGMDNYISKPIDIQEIVRIVSNIL